MKKIIRNGLSLLLGAALLLCTLPGIIAADDAAKAKNDAIRQSMVKAAEESKSTSELAIVNKAIAQAVEDIKLDKLENMMTTAGISVVDGVATKANDRIHWLLDSVYKFENLSAPLYTQEQIDEILKKYETIRGTADIIAMNTPQQIMRAYAAAQPGDFLLKTEGTARAYLVKSVSVTYLFDEISVDPLKSTVTFLNKKGEQTDSFAELYGEDGFVPYTLDVLDLPENEPVVPDHSETCLSKAMTDVDKDAWYHEAVDFALENKIMGGYNATTFGPNDTLSRAMVVQILYNKEGQPAVSGAHSFTDAPADQWYNNAIIWGTTKGVMGGYGDGKFGPADSVTLEQIAVILWNYSGNPTFTGTADSVGAHSGWAANGLSWAVENGLLEGVPYEVVTAPATRAQTAQIFMNYLSK